MVEIMGFFINFNCKDMETIQEKGSHENWSKSTNDTLNLEVEQVRLQKIKV